MLPSGPPPFKPTAFSLKLHSLGILAKLREAKLFRKIQQSKVYYLFLDTIQQMAILAEKLARKKEKFDYKQMIAIQAVTNKLASKKGELMKLQWPLVMLNPQFMREIMSNPTFLVMIFHAIEVAYMSIPIKFWLKPLVKLVKQRHPEKEEQIWWNRKRLYETLNGLGSSELQPNLKTKDFRHPGKPAVVAFPRLARTFRKLLGRPDPNPTYYSYAAMSNPTESNTFQTHHQVEATSPQQSWQQEILDLPHGEDVHQEDNIIYDGQDSNDNHPSLHSSNYFENPAQEETQEIYEKESSSIEKPQLMTLDELNSLEPMQKELVLSETRRSLIDMHLAENNLNKQREFIRLISNGDLNLI